LALFEFEFSALPTWEANFDHFRMHFLDLFFRGFSPLIISYKNNQVDPVAFTVAQKVPLTGTSL